MSITIVARLTAKQGSEQQLEAALRAMIPKVREESGATAYILHRSVKNPALFVFYEVYKDEAALDHHTKTPHMAELQSKLPALLDGRPTIDILTELDKK
ncbi:MAG: putative quinol monooxygenase [Candidatus Binataceae bacterium]|jgi:quinol monooxygenase YgiN